MRLEEEENFLKNAVGGVVSRCWALSYITELIILVASLLCLESSAPGLVQAARFPLSLFFLDCCPGPATLFASGETLHP